MSVNKFAPHVLVLPEDDANGEIATGFALEVRHPRRIQVLPPAGGWINARELLFDEHVAGMERFPERRFVLLIDFDDQSERGDAILQRVTPSVRGRAFLIGVRTEPEDLRQAGLGTLEDIGGRLAVECRERQADLWNHDLLKHNGRELERLHAGVRQILFD